MTAYDLMLKTNDYLIRGGELTEPQRANIVRQLLAARSSEQTRVSYDKAMRNDTGMYPRYFIPPYNGGKKLQTVVPMSPKTHILSANAYELEILRLLCLFAPEHPQVKEMVGGTLKRLRGTCFGNGCAAGECFHAALPVLRFLIAAAPNETAWMNKLVSFFNAHYGDQKRHSGVQKYYALCLSEMDQE